jgi:hypothetical protein
MHCFAGQFNLYERWKIQRNSNITKIFYKESEVESEEQSFIYGTWLFAQFAFKPRSDLKKPVKWI